MHDDRDNPPNEEERLINVPRWYDGKYRKYDVASRSRVALSLTWLIFFFSSQFAKNHAVGNSPQNCASRMKSKRSVRDSKGAPRGEMQIQAEVECGGFK